MSIILGNGKDGIVYTLLYRGREYAVKQFKPQKSLNKIQLEADLQTRAANIGISPKVKECNLDKRYIRMDKLDKSLYKLMQKKGGKLPIKYQKSIVEMADKLDKLGIFHNDPNIANFMIKGDKLYIIDYGFAKPINTRIIKKYTNTPNKKYMVWGFLLKCREEFGPDIKYSYLSKQLEPEIRKKFNF